MSTEFQFRLLDSGWNRQEHWSRETADRDAGEEPMFVGDYDSGEEQIRTLVPTLRVFLIHITIHAQIQGQIYPTLFIGEWS
ncbi:hypothetical protein LXL04_000832 [Taraxacum kok-saghyz]